MNNASQAFVPNLNTPQFGTVRRAREGQEVTVAFLLEELEKQYELACVRAVQQHTMARVPLNGELSLPFDCRGVRPGERHGILYACQKRLSGKGIEAPALLWQETVNRFRMNHSLAPVWVKGEQRMDQQVKMNLHPWKLVYKVNDQAVTPATIAAHWVFRLERTGRNTRWYFSAYRNKNEEKIQIVGFTPEGREVRKSWPRREHRYIGLHLTPQATIKALTVRKAPVPPDGTIDDGDE